jgi:hypothetical protein
MEPVTAVKAMERQNWSRPRLHDALKRLEIFCARDGRHLNSGRSDIEADLLTRHVDHNGGSKP